MRIINVYQPGGKIEEFFRAVSRHENLPTAEQVVKKTYTQEQVEGLHRLFDAHGIDLLGPGIVPE